MISSSAIENLSKEQVDKFKKYLTRTTTAFIDVEDEKFDQFLEGEQLQIVIKNFLIDSQLQLMIISILNPESEENTVIRLITNIENLILEGEGLAYIKKVGALKFEEGTPRYKKAFHVLNLGDLETDFNPYDLTHVCIKNAFVPIFNHIKRINPSVSKISSKVTIEPRVINSIQKKLQDLDITLIQNNKMVEIPEVTFQYEDKIVQFVQECKKEGLDADFSNFPKSELEDIQFITKLTQSVTNWHQMLLTLIKNIDKYKFDSVLDETQFYSNYLTALKKVEKQIESFETKLTKKILKEKKRYHSVASFENDVNFKNHYADIQTIADFMKDIPINDLLASNQIGDVGKSLESIWNHFNKLVNIMAYPVKRCVNLIESLSRDVTRLLLKIVRDARILDMNMKEFLEFYEKVKSIFVRWEYGQREFREVYKKNRADRNTGSTVAVKPDHIQFKERIYNIHNLREQHENLRNIYQDILVKEKHSQEKSNLSNFMKIEDIDKAFENFYKIDILDLSNDGEEAFEAVKKKYESDIDAVEKTIINKIRERLGAATNASEMFRVFSKFSSLLKRPQVKSAIFEYQDTLIKSFKKDLGELRDKFKSKYDKSGSKMIAQFYDIPDLTGSIIWNQEINRKLKKSISNVGSVMGDGWAKTPTGREIQSYENFFTNALNEGNLRIESFKQTYAGFDIGDEFIFIIREKRGSNDLELHVNFDEDSIERVKEMRNLLKLPLDSFFRFSTKFNFSKKVWPLFLMASSLTETVDLFNYLYTKIDSNIEKLLAKQIKELQQVIRKGSSLTWSDDKTIDKYIRGFGEKVNMIEDTASFILEKTEVINSTLEFMKTCNLDLDLFRNKIEEIQTVLDEFSFKGYANLHLWVKDLEASVEEVLKSRLKDIIELWLYEFENYRTKNKDRKLIRENTMHEIKVQNQLLFIEPSTEYARAFWMSHFHSSLGIVCNLKKLDPGAFNVWATTTKTESEKTYLGLLHEIEPEVLNDAYERIDKIICSAEKYVETWLNYQALWEISTKNVFDRLGNDIQLWQTILNDIKSGRTTFDNSETESFFGAIRINYRMVQNKINNKYDSWHKEILNQFGKTLNESMQSFFATLGQARQKLERINFTGSDDIVVAISDLQYSKKNMNKWNEELDRFKDGQKLLERQRYHFPSDWTFIDQIEGDWLVFRQILSKKSQAFDKLFEELRSKLEGEEGVLQKKTEEVEKVWDEKKPYKGEMKPKEALDVLKQIEGRLIEVSEGYENLNKAKDLMNLGLCDNSHVESLLEETRGLKEVWQELAKVWVRIDEMYDTNLNSSNPMKMVKKLEGVIEDMNSFPNKLRSNEAFSSKKDEVKKLRKMTLTINNLRSETFKERHWKVLLKKINLKKRYSDLTIGALWEHDLIKYEAPINEIVAKAQGEFVLEDMIRKIKEFWQVYELELVRYQNRCKLIRGWDDMFNKLDEDLGALSSMKLSPHFKSFEEEINPWNERLQKIRIIFDIWIDVQRKWVYLEGIFFGSEEIKIQLANDYNRFKGIDNEFTSLMKKASQRPKMLDVINNENLEKTLERLSESLDKIQKALTDYLETQRQKFSRFYFVGDEDLLEIIGNSKDVINIQKHFPKMFAGISNIINENNGDLLKGMQSKEGEQVTFTKAFKISDDNKIDRWLKKIEDQMKLSLATDLENSIKEIGSVDDISTKEKFMPLRKSIGDHSSQAVMLALQIVWTELIEEQFNKGEIVTIVTQRILTILGYLAEEVLSNIETSLRKKFEQLITESVHQRDVCRILEDSKVVDARSFSWQYYMRFYFNSRENNVLKKLAIKMGNAFFNYSFEYLGVSEKLVQTPLTDKCYLTLTQALSLRMGGAPFGPAGTGKTESVKMLGSTLGNFVLVFNCDENFNFKAMGRIFIGLCQVGAWGCFDEFNRLEERILSAVSQQILTIQTGLRDKIHKIELMGRDVKLNASMGIFITMNPGYAGRSNLPENLKQLFRQMAMVKPDRELIAQVMLYSRGFKSAERIAGKIVSLFELCNDQLSSQPHYDFGLRSLKSVLNSAGNLKRAADLDDIKDVVDFEQDILLRSLCDTVVPKLVAEDLPLLSNLVSGVFPGTEIPTIYDPELNEALKKECKRRFLLTSEKFIEKVMQLNQIMKLAHGVMVVGPSGSGKSQAWHVLLDALTRVDGIKGDYYIIDPKAISKDDLYGRLDNTTLDWNDGIFTHILRKICENQRGESNRRHWIVFDGDVDPEWAENLNSVLDDNKLLTLPNGERIRIPPNVRILFEVESLKWATLATVSRCGMVWFSESIVETNNIFHHYLERIKEPDFDAKTREIEEDQEGGEMRKDDDSLNELREKCVEYVKPLFEGDACFAVRALELVKNRNHVMEYSRIRVLEAAFALVRKGIAKIIEYNEFHPDFPLEDAIMSKFMKKWTIIGFNWGLAGDLKLFERAEFWSDLSNSISVDVELPTINEATTLIDYEVKIEDGEWSLWKNKVPYLDLDPERVTDADLIITTVDTLRHQEILCSWLSEHRPFILCGPPGSGKTMTLMSTLKSLPDFEMIFINFSSSTTPSLIQKQFDHYCEYTKTHKGVILRPKQPNKWLVVFCDEINLPDEDDYGTQAVITFLRQLTEQHGFWRTAEKEWVTLDRIQFVGACNPPTDVGRHEMSLRFLRHAPLILVDFPGYDSLVQIYGTFNRAMLKKAPPIKGHADSLTEAMVEYYTRSQRRFTSDMQAHYIYSPRELTRWKYAVNEAMDTFETLEDLVRLYAHEALRLFQDRLVYPDEREWCEKQVDDIVSKCFPTVNSDATERPILFSSYLTKSYRSVQREQLREFIAAKLKVFNEEEYDVQLVVFDSVLDHITRIDRVLKQPIGHCLLIGASGVGKTTLSRFVSWMNNLTVFQIKAGRNYGLHDFDADLREVMKRSGCKGEKITFIFDESNVLSVAFLERMNALLASGEVPGLFEGDEYLALISACKEGFGGGKVMETEEEIYKKFIRNVQRNLHVVFTMNPANPDFSNRAGSSPAIFNRCVIDWFGEWSDAALFQVARELTEKVDLPQSSFENLPEDNHEVRHSKVTEIIVHIHNSVRTLNKKLRKNAKKFNYITPRDYLDFIRHFVTLQREKKAQLEEQQYHINSGLAKLKETEQTVLEMKESLSAYKKELTNNEKEAKEKLKMMVSEQKKAEKEKEVSIKLSAELEEKQKVIQERTKEVEGELAEAEPALRKAEKSVSGITSNELNNIRSLGRPPDRIRMTMQAVCLMLTGKKLDWRAIGKEMRKKDFIHRIIEFDTDSIKMKLKNKLMNDYINTKEWDIPKIYKSFKAAGAIAEWLTSQLKFADILTKIDPLRQEVKSLKDEETSLIAKRDELEELIKTLEVNIDNYEKEYAELIAKVENIKKEMQKVEMKVERSSSLLVNLSAEKFRWEETSQGFDEQMKTMTGDSLLSAAFLAYIGFFDQFYREVLIGHWKDYFEEQGFVFRRDMSIIEFLSKASDRMEWQGHKLPADDLCTENAIILSRFNRYPLVIDPAGQAMEFILSYYKDKKISRTSFADEAFMKHLETSIRFGCPILVQDVEKIDPILNSVLNKEIHRQGGRVLIRVGDHEIDFSDTFKLFMITRDAQARFTPDLCSRVTFVNFTVTPASLQNQCLMLYLKNERPDVEQKRINLLKLQGEFIVKLRKLEDDLLNKLSEVEGNILEDEDAINTLERLKKEASVVTAEMKKSSSVLAEVEATTNEYENISRISAQIYFSLQSIGEIYTFYQFSLKYYMNIIFNLLGKNEDLKKIDKKKPKERIKIISQQLFVNVYHKTYYSLLNKDVLPFALKLAQIKVGSVLQEDFRNMLKPGSLIKTNLSHTLIGGMLKENQLRLIEELGSRNGYEDLVDHMERNEEEWKNFLMSESVAPVPIGWESSSKFTMTPPEFKEAGKELMYCTVGNILRPDQTISRLNTFLEKCMGEKFVNVPVLDLSLRLEDSEAKAPLLLSSAPGFDASYKVEELAKSLDKKYTAVAIGSAEGFELARKSIDKAIQSGSWVLLKNVHLATDWLTEVEQKVFRSTPHKSFRLFMTMEFSDKIPNTLLRQSLKFLFELPDGVKASISRTYGSVMSAARSDQEPIERSRLHFLLAWLHSVILERMRYRPIGWSKGYEFNEADLRCAMDLVDEYIDLQGAKRNIQIDKIPWDAIRSVLINNIYGGKIDNEYDTKILKSLVEQYFCTDSFDFNKRMIPELDDEKLKVPEAQKTSDFSNWVKNLPSNESPIWSGLPHNAEKVLKEKKAAYTLGTLWKIQDVNDEQITDVTHEEEDNEQKGAQVKWLGELAIRVKNYKEILPGTLTILTRSKNSLLDPLFRFLEREVKVASKLLDVIRKNLSEITQMCSGEIQPLTDLKNLAEIVYTGVVPKSWKKYTIPNSVDVTAWVSDFSKRLKQFSKFVNTKEWQKKGVCLGGIIFPEAFMTATRQYVAQNNEASLDELELRMELWDGQPAGDDCFLLEEMIIEGARWEGENLSKSKELVHDVKTIKCSWVKIANPHDRGKIHDGEIMVPVYLNRTRQNLLFSVKLKCGDIDTNFLYKRGVALIAWKGE